MAKRFDQEHTEIEMEQVLGRSSGLHPVYLFRSKRNDYYPGNQLTSSHNYYLFAPEANIYSPIISGAPYSLWSKSWPARDKMHEETLFSIDWLQMRCSTSR